MLDWLRSLWAPQRDIFRYWDGSRQRAIDPIAAWQALHEHPTYNDERHPRGVDRGDKESIDITCRAVRDVFGVAEFDPETRKGLTILEQLALMAVFMGYLDALKKTTEPSATSPSSTASTSSESGGPTTSVTSASG